MTRLCYCTDAVDETSCSMPAPTLLMHDYTTVTMTIVNLLNGSDVVYGPGTEYWNKYKDMDTTNLHPHGLHVSPSVDNVIPEIHPNGDSYSYPYEIGYHSPGTYWYHAHHHGAASYQIDAGLHGALLMHTDSDATDNYPEAVLMFEWMYVVPQDVCNPDGRECSGGSTNPQGAYEYSSRFIVDDVAEDPDIVADYALCDIYCAFPPEQRLNSEYVYDAVTDLPYNSTDLLDGFPDHDLFLFFTNGQLQPVVNITNGAFHRFRLINSLSNWYLQLKWPDECESYMIATDGHYINPGAYMNFNLSSPSHENEIILSSGARMDVMVKCLTNGVYDVLASEYDHGDTNMGKFQRVYDGRVLFSIQVNDGVITSGTDELPTSYPDKPVGSYLEDTSTLQTGEYQSECGCNYMDEASSKCEFQFNFQGGPDGGPAVNSKTFNFSVNNVEKDAMLFMAANQSYEIVLNMGQAPHPYHQHTFPFQVQDEVGPNGFIALPTTWWDTIGNKPNGPGDYISARFWTRDYDGLIVFHCHFLQHEDLGMLAYFLVVPEIPSFCPNQGLTAPTTTVVDVPTTTEVVMETTEQFDNGTIMTTTTIQTTTSTDISTTIETCTTVVIMNGTTGTDGTGAAATVFASAWYMLAVFVCVFAV
eukprot:CAMPEP_0197024426 /NCGR_PEP_ID=MMETSP1384-20130603/4967_1 /TAXON_ID=29189 /ORGANISM="Ammonia sp." /LENGTH=642 /DNA_ID=CAMNT_0042452807 /DNA_START=233 /DNA_END=2161 /DNA_ORIENTATION=-